MPRFGGDWQVAAGSRAVSSPRAGSGSDAEGHEALREPLSCEAPTPEAISDLTASASTDFLLPFVSQ